MKRFFLPGLLTVLALGSVPAHAHECRGNLDVLEETFSVSSGGTLELDLDAGDVEVTRGGGGVIRIRAERCLGSREQAKNHRLYTRTSGNNVYVKSRRENERGNLIFRRGRNELRVVLKATIPVDYNVDFSSGAGNVTLSGLVGAVAGKTGAGNVVASEMRGQVNISTGSGNVKLGQLVGRVDVQSGAGNVELRDVTGELEVRVGAGNIVAEIFRQPDARISLQSGAGNVTAVMASTLRMDVEAVASVGAASTDFPLSIEGTWMTKSFEGRINGGGPPLTMRSGVGNVSLRKRM